MPIYAYACKNCGHEFDALQKMAEDPLVDCPGCGAPDLKRLLSAPRFRLKGSGWYETDFKSDNQRNLAGNDNDKPSSTSSDKAPGDKKGESDSADKKADKKPGKKAAGGESS